MAISFVAATEANSNTNGTSATVTAPAGITNGDVIIIAITTVTNTFSANTFTAPSGFTKVRTTETANGAELAQCIMKKVANSESGNYTVTWSQTAAAYKIACAVYRGATGAFLAEGSANEYLSSSPLSTPSVSNSNATSWRITVGSMGDPYDTVTALSTSEATRRAGGSAPPNDGGYYYGIQFYDSNAAVATGSHSRSFTGTGASTWAAIAWIGILEAGSATPASGSFAATLGAVSVAAAGEVHDDATVAMSLGPVTMDGTGAGQPEAGTGGFDLALSGVSMAFAAGVPVTGTMDATVLPSISIQAETRVFGIRVIPVERDESRVITVRSRGVDD